MQSKLPIEEFCLICESKKKYKIKIKIKIKKYTKILIWWYMAILNLKLNKVLSMKNKNYLK